MQENFERGWDCHANRIYIRFSLTKLKIKKKLSRYLVYSKKFVHTNLKELNFTGMKLRGCLASFFAFSGELNFAND